MINPPMTTTQRDIDLIISREGRRNTVYLDSKGYPTVGIGHMDPNLRVGDVWTNRQIDEVFKRDIKVYEDAVNACVNVPLKDFQFGALVSFSLNCGRNALAHGNSGGPSSILRALNAGDDDGAANAFDNWMADVEVRSRRRAEREQFRGTIFAARLDEAGNPIE